MKSNNLVFFLRKSTDSLFGRKNNDVSYFLGKINYLYCFNSNICTYEYFFKKVMICYIQYLHHFHIKK